MAYKWQALAIGGVYIGGATIERSAWPILLPTIRDHFGVSTSEVVWLVVMFALGMAGSTLTVGHLGDKLGHRRLAVIGCLLEGTLLILAALAPSFWMLLGLRVVQGAAAAAALNNLQALTVGAWGAAERGRALGFMTALPPIGLILGPLYTGFVNDIIGWQWVIFFCGVHIASEAALARFFMHEDSFPTEPAHAILRGLDWAGAFGFLGALVSLILAARFAASDALRPLAVLMFPIAALTAFAVVRLESRSSNPVLNLQLFTKRTFAVACSGMVLFSLIAGANTFLFPFFLQKGVGWSVAYSASVLIALNAVQPVGAPLGGWLSDKAGARPVQLAGIGVVLTGLLLGSQLSGSPETLRVVLVLLVLSAGMSLFNPANNRTIYNEVPRTALGTASAISASGRYVGQSMGAALGAAILVAAGEGNVVAAFHTAMFLLAALLAGGMALIMGSSYLPSLLRGRREPVPSETGQP